LSLVCKSAEDKKLPQLPIFLEGKMVSDNLRELSDDELDIVSGGVQSAAMRALATNTGNCQRQIPMVTNATGQLGVGTGWASCTPDEPSELGPDDGGGYTDGNPNYY
jgi:hypothetical protein